MATAVTSDSNLVVSRDYTDIYAIKDTALKTLAQKYFPDIPLSKLNIGVLGFLLEQVGNITEDSFNTASILMQEAFPNRAIIPESIYSHAAIFQISNAFVKCGKCSFIMKLSADEILENAEIDSTNKRYHNFFIDRRMIFTVDDIPFTLDYDIQIIAKEFTRGSETDYNYSAKYVIKESDRNSTSNINDPYIKIRKLPDNTILLYFTANQMERTEIFDTITKNTRINYPILEYNFDNNLVDFDIFYKDNNNYPEWTQMTKLIKFSIPITNPFCYYAMTDEKTLQISFTSRDGYFQPEFNSSIRIILYTTIAKNGEFEAYTGNHVEIQPYSEVYPYNESITFAIKPVSDCSGAGIEMDLEAMQALTVEAYSTATEISSENDLAKYFYNFKYRYGNEIFIIKRRDDVVERLFSTFLLVKNNDYIYPTNTLGLSILEKQFDTSDDSGMHTLQAGHVFVYDEFADNGVIMVNNVMAFDTEKVEALMKKFDFVYTNPFIISVSKNPTMVGLYKNIVSQTSSLDYIPSDVSYFNQFITSKINLKRGLSIKPQYNLSLSIVPSSSMEEYIHSDPEVPDYRGNDVRIVLGIVNPQNGRESGFIELYPTYINPDDPLNVTFSRDVLCIDHITNNSRFALQNVVRVDHSIGNLYIPIKDVQMNVYILNKLSPDEYDISSIDTHVQEMFPDMEDFVVVDKYTNKNDLLTFIQPLNMMRSTITYSTKEVSRFVFQPNDDPDAPEVIRIDGKPHSDDPTEDIDPESLLIQNVCKMELIPFIKADIITDNNNFNTFIQRVTSNYDYLNECLPILRNNTNLDIKFYNTYGRSNNYYIDESKEELIDRVNLSIKFEVSLIEGTDEVKAETEIRDYIKTFIESVNTSGTNALYISNLIRNLENTFAYIHHLRFLGINDYDVMQQTITVKESDLNNLTKEERRSYVPEVLVCNHEDIGISIVD